MKHNIFSKLPEMLKPKEDILEDPPPPEEGDVYYAGEKKKDEEKPNIEDVIFVLESVFDPEIPASIYSIGLIYDVQVDRHGNVDVLMTLTTPMCPVAGSLPAEVADKVAAISKVGRCNVKITWDPPWTPDMMSDEARMILGML